MSEQLTHGAIETRYAGHLFRSRLEAKWAVFFDALGIKWQYERQGYEHEGRRYLPDFEFDGDFVEVKGDPNGLRSDFDRMQRMLGCISPLPGFVDGKSGLLLLGEIPRDRGGLALHPYLMRSETGGLERHWAGFVPLKDGGAGLIRVEDGLLAALSDLRPALQIDNNPSSDGWSVTSRTFGKGGFKDISDAYAAARSARFEHGEQGAV